VWEVRSQQDSVDILEQIQIYGPIPSLEGIVAENLISRLASDKKTIQGKEHFVLPARTAEARVASGVDQKLVGPTTPSIS
jgi:3-dehydroquinate synthase